MNLAMCFNILGLKLEADAAQAKRAYKSQVRRWHPDQFPEGSSTKAGAEEQLKQINIAYTRIKEHLATHRPDPGDKTSATQTHPQTGGNDETTGEQADKRSWIDHLFDTLNTFAGNHSDNPPPSPPGKVKVKQPKRFEQVLDEMAGGSITARKNRRSVNPDAVAARTTAGYRRYRRSGTSVGSVGGTQRPGPIKPIRRIRGIGKGR